MKDLEVQYDSICLATMYNIKTMTSGADAIVFRNFDGANKEHLFVIAVTMSCWNVLGERKVLIDGGLFARARLNKKYKDISKIGKSTGKEQTFVDVNELLEFMRGHACQICGEDFTFGKIYDKYYSNKEM